VSAPEPSHRIGEFSRRVGVSPHLLRAWEQRYGLLRPVRSPGGFRLYGANDAQRVERMRDALEQGLSAAEAARAALNSAPSSPDGLVESARMQLLRAIEQYDEAGVHAVLDEAIAAFGLEAFVRDLILPTLVEVGRRWRDEKAEVSQEHFTSNVVRGWLVALARLWGRGAGPLALLACAPGEQHDISLIIFGLLLRSYGWRVLFLGANTPLWTLEETASTTAPAVVVLVVFDPALLESEGPALRRLGRIAPLFLSGPAASRELSTKLRVRRLEGDLVEAARTVALMPNG
jgi:MerR family transcriptional regulator, light-induced transcriptional regulator